MNSVLSSQREALAAAVEAAVAESLEQSWAWGHRDCAMWCASVIAGPLGYDPAAPWRGRYSTPRGFLRVLRRDGFDTLSDALAAVAAERGWLSIDPALAARGDVGIAEMRGFQSCVLNWTSSHWLGFRQFGSGFAETKDIARAWSIA